MTDLRIGSLCTGYGGLDHAVEAVTGATTAWVSDIDKGACKIIAHRYPHVPNIGDLTTVDWDQLKPVDILTAGYPCQPFSHAGQRQGTNDVRHLWPFIREAIRHLRPRLTVLENVAGHRSLGFDRVLGDMAEDGLHVRWASLRAADIGACHGRDRLFIVAHTEGNPRWLSNGNNRPSPNTHDRAGHRQWAREESRQGSAGDVALLPTPMSAEGTKPSNTMGVTRRLETGQVFLTNVIVSLAGLDPSEALLPTPTATDANASGGGYNGQSNVTLTDATVRRVSHFGDYARAIARWEHTLGRPAPEPTEPTGKGGRRRLSPAFVEWMMGLPAGWATDVPGITRNEALKALGNGVVPQQAEAALRHMLAWEMAA